MSKSIKELIGVKIPGIDGRGPRGEGPMTGRGMGRCQPETVAENAQRTTTPIGLGRGGRPRGCGRGFGGGRMRSAFKDEEVKE